MDAFFHMGDNVYTDHPEHPEVQRYNYYRRQSRPEFRRFVSDVANYAIWDDHDFTVNDGIGSPHADEPAWKRKVWEMSTCSSWMAAIIVRVFENTNRHPCSATGRSSG